MIIVLLLICVAFAITGFILGEKFTYEITPAVFSVAGVTGGIVIFVAMIILLINYSFLDVIDGKIDMYQCENKQIEHQISECVKQYQQYEKDIFTEVAPDSSITLVALYPELKADTLVTKQIEIYVANNEKIKELKEQKINGNVIRWWVCFGGAE